MNNKTHKKKRKNQLLKKRIIPLSIFIIAIVLVLTVVFYPRLNLELIGGDDITVPYGQEFNDPGYTARYGNNECSEVAIDGTVDTEKLGTYFITYTVTYKNETKTATRKVTVADLTGPVIDTRDTVVAFKGYPVSEIELSYTAIDHFDGDCASSVKRTDYENYIILTATDQKGNVTEKRIDVNFVDDTTPPVITLTGQRCIILKVGESYTDQGATATDDRDGNISDKITATSLPDISQVGTYEINYTVTDKGGNKTTETRYIIVIDNSKQVDPGKKVIYLTFDDGPSPNTPYVLDILKQYGVKATFFVTAQHTKSLPLISRIFNEGHTVAAHTYSHKWEIYQSEESYFKDLDNINKIIAQYTGSPSRIVRFPGGSSNRVSTNHKKGIMSKLVGEFYKKGYVYFDWNIDSMDTSTSDPQKIAKNVTSRLKDGYYNVLMHDTKTAHRKSLPIIIEYALKNGYTFLPLTETSPAVHHSIKN